MTDPTGEMRTCSSCGLDLPLAEYRRDSGRTDGLSGCCNACKNVDHIAYASKRYRTDPLFSERERARRRRRYQETGR